MSLRYYLYKRGSTYYAKLVNPTNGKILEARSTHKQNEDEANLEAAKWLVNGIPQGSGPKRQLHSLQPSSLKIFCHGSRTTWDSVFLRRSDSYRA